MTEFDIDALIFGTKVCPECGAEKAANSEQFGPDETKPNGLRGTCRSCRAARDRERYRDDPAQAVRKHCEYVRKKARNAGRAHA